MQFNGFLFEPSLSGKIKSASRKPASAALLNGSNPDLSFASLISNLIRKTDTRQPASPLSSLKPDPGNVLTPQKKIEWITKLKTRLNEKGVPIDQLKTDATGLKALKDFLGKIGYDTQKVTALCDDIETRTGSEEIPISDIFTGLAAIPVDEMTPFKKSTNRFIDLSALPYIETHLAQTGLSQNEIQQALSGAIDSDKGIDPLKLANHLRKIKTSPQRTKITASSGKISPETAPTTTATDTSPTKPLSLDHFISELEAFAVQHNQISVSKKYLNKKIEDLTALIQPDKDSLSPDEEEGEIKFKADQVLEDKITDDLLGRFLDLVRPVDNPQAPLAAPPQQFSSPKKEKNDKTMEHIRENPVLRSSQEDPVAQRFIQDNLVGSIDGLKEILSAAPLTEKPSESAIQDVPLTSKERSRLAAFIKAGERHLAEAFDTVLSPSLPENSTQSRPAPLWQIPMATSPPSSKEATHRPDRPLSRGTAPTSPSPNGIPRQSSLITEVRQILQNLAGKLEANATPQTRQTDKLLPLIAETLSRLDAISPNSLTDTVKAPIIATEQPSAIASGLAKADKIKRPRASQKQPAPSHVFEKKTIGQSLSVKEVPLPLMADQEDLKITSYRFGHAKKLEANATPQTRQTAKLLPLIAETLSRLDAISPNSLTDTVKAPIIATEQPSAIASGLAKADKIKRPRASQKQPAPSHVFEKKTIGQSLSVKEVPLPLMADQEDLKITSYRFGHAKRLAEPKAQTGFPILQTEPEPTSSGTKSSHFKSHVTHTMDDSILFGQSAMTDTEDQKAPTGLTGNPPLTSTVTQDLTAIKSSPQNKTAASSEFRKTHKSDSDKKPFRTSEPHPMDGAADSERPRPTQAPPSAEDSMVGKTPSTEAPRSRLVDEPMVETTPSPVPPDTSMPTDQEELISGIKEIISTHLIQESKNEATSRPMENTVPSSTTGKEPPQNILEALLNRLKPESSPHQQQGDAKDSIDASTKQPLEKGTNPQPAIISPSKEAIVGILDQTFEHIQTVTPDSKAVPFLKRLIEKFKNAPEAQTIPQTPNQDVQEHIFEKPLPRTATVFNPTESFKATSRKRQKTPSQSIGMPRSKPDTVAEGIHHQPQPLKNPAGSAMDPTFTSLSSEADEKPFDLPKLTKGLVDPEVAARPSPSKEGSPSHKERSEDGPKSTEQGLASSSDVTALKSTRDFVFGKTLYGRTVVYQVLNQVGGKIIQSFQGSENEIKFQLSPPHLGRMHMQVENTRDGVKVNILTEQHTAKEILLAHTAELKNALMDQGLRLEKIDIQMTYNFDQSMAQNKEGTQNFHHKNRKNASGASQRNPSIAVGDTASNPGRPIEQQGLLNLVA